jgi:hypothetical protein
MSNLPTVGGDNNSWGTVLNNFLLVSHNPDGSIRNDDGNDGITAITVITQTAYDNLASKSSRTLYIITTT